MPNDPCNYEHRKLTPEAYSRLTEEEKMIEELMAIKRIQHLVYELITRPNEDDESPCRPALSGHARTT